MFNKEVITLDELAALGKGTIFVPWNVGGPAQGDPRIISSVTKEQVLHVGVVPKFVKVNGVLEIDRYWSNILLNAHNRKHYRFIVIDSLDELCAEMVEHYQKHK